MLDRHGRPELPALPCSGPGTGAHPIRELKSDRIEMG